MMAKLAAEEELFARSIAAHPHLEPKDQTRAISNLARVAGLAEPARKASRADLGTLGITDVTGE